MENEQYIESGLSVGTTKIANKYEIFTEEEVDIINNKIPELDERVSIIEYEIEDINSSLGDKASKNEVFSMANMGQDIKEAMTGGSVAVVGVNSINSINLLKNSVTKSKTDFFNPNVINLLNLANSEITNINYSTGVKPSYICDDNSITCNTKDEDWLFFFIKLNLEVGKTYTCTLRNTNLNRDMDVGISYVNQPTEPKKFTFTKNNGEYKLTFECVSETNYIRIHGINGGINIKDIIFYEGAEDVVWTLDKDIYVTNISDGAISYEKLSDDIKQLFIKVEDLFNINGFEFLTGINVETFINNNDDTFYVEFNEGSSYLVFKGQQFKKGHKYVVTYDVTGDVDFNFGLRNSVIGYPNWQQIIIETTNQTGGATSVGYKIYNCEYDGCLGFNNSCSKAVKYTAKIKIFDVTEYTNKEIKKIDFLAAGHSDIVTNISDGAISHEKLSDDIKQLFTKVEDLFNINGFEFLTGNNVETFINNNDDTFYVEFNEGSSYLVFKGQQFKKGHKYVVTYDVTGDVDFNFGLRNSVIGYPNWQQIIIETTNQTGGATSVGYKIYNCEYDGCLGFNNSCSKAVKYTAKIKIFDVTEYTDEEIKKIDFLAAGDSAIVTNISDGAISYEKLSDDIKQLFIKVEDLFNINGFEFLTGINVETFINNNDDTFYVEFNEGSSYLVFKGQQFKKGHKYVVTYDVTGDVDFNFGLRNSVIGYPNWQQIIIETTNQTGGATSVGYKIYNCEYDGCLGFNNSCSKAVKYTAKIKIFDVTEYTDEEIKKIDFLSVGHSAMFVKNVGSGESSTSSNALANKKIVFYGDSISQSGYFQNMVKNYFDCDVVTNAIGGTTIGYQGSSCFSADERISQLPTDADLVLIMGGTNDWNRVNIGTIDFSSSSIDRTTIKGGLLYTIKGIQEQCPKATIIVCTAIGGRGSSGSSSHLYPLVDKYGQSTLDIRNATIEVANIANVECCDTWSCGINGFNRTKYIVDTVHPNTEGNKLIGNYIINFLKKYN